MGILYSRSLPCLNNYQYNLYKEDVIQLTNSRPKQEEECTETHWYCCDQQ